jgi:DNA-binding MarR family transcriptional regulator
MGKHRAKTPQKAPLNNRQMQTNPLETNLKIDRSERIFQQALLGLNITYHWSNQKTKEMLQPYGLTPQQYQVLRILKGQYPSPATNNLIKIKMSDKMSDISRLVDRLIFKGYAKRSTNGYDRRAVDIMISEQGFSLLKRIDREVNFTAVINQHLSEEEAKQLNGLVKKMRG